MCFRPDKDDAGRQLDPTEIPPGTAIQTPGDAAKLGEKSVSTRDGRAGHVLPRHVPRAEGGGRARSVAVGQVTHLPASAPKRMSGELERPRSPAAAAYPTEQLSVRLLRSSDSSIRKNEPIAERINKEHIQTTPRLFCDPRWIFFGDKLLHVFLYFVRVDLDGRTRTTVAVVL